MEKKRKKKLDVRQLAKEEKREDQKEAGFFDGRFVQRSEKSKKAYSRKKKHKGDNPED